MPAAERRPLSGGALLLSVALAVYAGTRLVGLTQFPIYFFCDEAIQANTAERFWKNHLRDSEGVLLPPYFLNDQRWAMSLNVYLLAAPVAIFGKSIAVTRGTFVAVSLFGAAALALALRIAGMRMWWSAPLLLAVLPVDFLHSRLALETTPAWYAAFLAAYLFYRLRSPRWLPAVLLAGAATFYSYTAGQGIVLVMGLLLLVVDARYHFRQPARRLLAALGLVAILAIPFVREHRRHPGSTREQLMVLHSYWIAPLPLTEKLATFGREYVAGLDLRYWFRPDEAELIRHRMDRMAAVPTALAPLAAVGIAACVWRFRRSPAHRVFLLSPLAVPFAAAIDHRQILRVLPMVAPIVLLVGVGLEEVVRLLRRAIPDRILAAGTAAALAAAAVRLTVVSLHEGPLWFRDYGLYGMQYGAKQVFDGIREDLRRFPRDRIFLTSTWANNPNEFLDFFLAGDERARAQMGDIEALRFRRLELAGDRLFVMTAVEYARARGDPKFRVGKPVRTIFYPDGRPGFYFTRLAYSPEADAIFAAEREARWRPREEIVEVAGHRMILRHSMTDMGSVADLFDGRLDSTFRGLEANPFVMEFVFEEPEPLTGVELRIGRMECDVSVDVTPAGLGQPLSLTRRIRGLVTDSTEKFPFPAGAVVASKVRIEIREMGSNDPAHIEVREVRFGWGSPPSSPSRRADG